MLCFAFVCASVQRDMFVISAYFSPKVLIQLGVILYRCEKITRIGLYVVELHIEMLQVATLQ